MARRLALLALLLLAGAVAAYRPPASRTPALVHSDYDSLDPLDDWDDYNPYETSPVPSLESDKPSAKVILRGHVPKINVSTKSGKRDDKNKVIKTSIKIESYTNIIVTKSPQVVNRIKVNTGTKVPYRPTKVPVAPVWEVDLDQKPSTTTKRSTARRSTTPRHAATLRPAKTTRRPAISSAPTRRPSSRRPIANKPRTTTKKPKPQKNKRPCPQKNVGWLTSFFQENELKKSPKQEVKSGWFVGRCYFNFS